MSDTATHAFAPGDRVRIVRAWSFRDGDAGTVTKVHDRPNLAFTVTVSCDRDDQTYPFKPDELERIPDAREDA